MSKEKESKFVGGEHSFHFPICNRCKHHTGWRRCSAFPDGIPSQIIKGENDHKKPLIGQGNNITFEPIKD